jgi:trans-2,3-dihydro-3-hydroxyanthranilate isomerase
MRSGHTYRFVHVDVFTERAFGGNQLAVVFGADGLPTATMQAVAREMNLAETTFLLPSRRADCVARVRIFTPAREMPFAGHPTIGTAWVLAHHGLVPGAAPRFALDEEIGPVPVALDGDPRAPRFVWMDHRDATFGPEVRDRAGVARALRLKVADLLAAPIEAGSTGNRFLYVPLRDRRTVDAVDFDQRAFEEAVPDLDGIGAFVFAPDPDPEARRVYSRMFAPAHGVAEDPATGSASGALGAYLVRHRLVHAEDETRIVSEQGTKMGRPSFVHIALVVHADRISDIRVGGGVVPVIDGTLTVPEP